MRIADVLLLDLDIEVAGTRQMLELVPEDKASWKPDEKSMALGSLAKHVAMLPAFGALFLTSDSMDASAGPRASVFVDKADLFSSLEDNVTRLREALNAASDEYLMAEWKFLVGDRVLYAAPRAVLYRMMFLNHLVHHRAQLGVYFRLLHIPLPGLYGPSADTTWRVLTP